MKKHRIVCLALTLGFAAVTATVVVAAKPTPIPPNCRFVLCAYPDCGPNEKTVIPAGQCCPVCVPL